MVKNLKLLDKALQLLPEVKETVVEPLDIAAFLKPLKKGDSVEIDFGRHLVGHIKLKLGYVRSHPDAPVWLRFSFAENKKEFEERVEDYQGWICSAWVQQEQVHIDLVPGEYFLPRRYSFRYVKIEVLDVSSKFASSIDDMRINGYHLLKRQKRLRCLQQMIAVYPHIIARIRNWNSLIALPVIRCMIVCRRYLRMDQNVTRDSGWEIFVCRHLPITRLIR